MKDPRQALMQVLQMRKHLEEIEWQVNQPSAAYQGWLQAQQERRDARSGVPGLPPQGAGSPSAQRSSAPGGGRSF